MKVKITTPIEIDEQKWRVEYGMEESSDIEIQRDIIDYFNDLISETVAQQIQRLGVGK